MMRDIDWFVCLLILLFSKKTLKRAEELRLGLCPELLTGPHAVRGRKAL